MQRWVWLEEEFGPKFQYLPGPEHVVADASSCLDKAPSPSDDKEDTDKTHKPTNCFATLDVDFLIQLGKMTNYIGRECIIWRSHKDDIVFPLSAQEISKHQQKDLRAYEEIKR
jgi:hypothetical protein